jgi:sec-independent protein translocase protein TatC
VIGWFLYGPVLNLILNPYCNYWKTIPPKLRVNRSCSLFFQEPLGAMVVKLKIVVFIGLVVVLPVLLYQLWMFIVPGLNKKERRMAIPFVGSSVVLFALGAFVSYIMLPKGLNFLLGFAGSQFAPILTGDRFITFVILVAVAFGLSFEFPVLLVFLQLVGVLTPQILLKGAPQRGRRKGNRRNAPFNSHGEFVDSSSRFRHWRESLTCRQEPRTHVREPGPNGCRDAER